MQNIKLKKRQIDLATLNMFQAPTKLLFWASHNSSPKKKWLLIVFTLHYLLTIVRVLRRSDL